MCRDFELAEVQPAPAARAEKRAHQGVWSDDARYVATITGAWVRLVRDTVAVLARATRWRSYVPVPAAVAAGVHAAPDPAGSDPRSRAGPRGRRGGSGAARDDSQVR